MGGVQSGRHARDLLDAGADLVAVGTETFRDPRAGARIAAELDAIDANSGMFAGAPEPARPRIAHSALKNPCKCTGYRQVPSMRLHLNLRSS